MAPNLALRDARRNAHLSQEDLARSIREAGWRTGNPAPCSGRTVQRWESGAVTCPQPRYLMALEAVLGQPADSLGFDADRRYGMDRDRVLADAGLDAAMPLPDPAGHYGPLSGIWLSEYEYPSAGRARTFRNRHYVMVLQRGAQVMVRSLPASSSQVSMDLTANGSVCTGTWTEQTEQDGYYKGAVYSGALQFLTDPTGHRLEGQWVGFGRNMKVNTGEWVLTLVEGDVGTDAVQRWNRVPEGGGGNSD
jgi:transcriptional regulator with XRE-family HTH domain